MFRRLETDSYLQNTIHSKYIILWVSTTCMTMMIMLSFFTINLFYRLTLLMHYALIRTARKLVPYNYPNGHNIKRTWETTCPLARGRVGCFVCVLIEVGI